MNFGRDPPRCNVGVPEPSVINALKQKRLAEKFAINESTGSVKQPRGGGAPQQSTELICACCPNVSWAVCRNQARLKPPRADRRHLPCLKSTALFAFQPQHCQTVGTPQPASTLDHILPYQAQNVL